MQRVRRGLSNLAVAVAVLACAPAAALAHGIQGRADLPVPIRAFYWASAFVLVVSFAGLSLAWHRPLVAGALDRWSCVLRLGNWARIATFVLRLMSVAGLALVVSTTFFGSTDLNANWAPVAIFVVWWIGIAACAATIGDVWRWLHPVAAIARWLRLEPSGSRPYAWGLWPAFFGLVAFTWLELVYPTAAHVRLLGALVVAWIAYTLWGMSRWGIETWLDNGEPFAAYTNVLAGLGICGRRSAGTACELRIPVLATTRLPPASGRVALAGLLIGSVSFDGLSRTLWWKRQVATVTFRAVDRGLPVDKVQIAMGTVGFAMMVSLAIGAFIGASLLARRIGRLPHQTGHGDTAQAFAHSLVPIAFAYVVAHYFSFFWFQSQELVRLASDPFGRGWDLMHTADFRIDYSTLSANAIWIVQVSAIVIGHVLGLMLAHDRALEISATSTQARAVRSQWAMLALMVLYTVGGLYFLSEGLNG